MEQYKIPKEYFECDNNMIYKPSGPDGKGWGKFRCLSEEDIAKFEEIKKMEEFEYKNKMEFLLPDNIIDVNENRDWEKKFLEVVKKKRDKIERKKNKKNHHNHHKN